jgi:hypothetical protein
VTNRHQQISTTDETDRFMGKCQLTTISHRYRANNYAIRGLHVITDWFRRSQSALADLDMRGSLVISPASKSDNDLRVATMST